MRTQSRGWERMHAITVQIPPLYFQLLRQLVDKQKYPSVSEAIRYAIRLLVNEEFKEGDGE